MPEFTKEYQLLLKKKWHKYVMEDVPFPDSDAEIRAFIYESWKRSKKQGIDPFEVKNKTLSPEELKFVLRKNDNLIQIAHPYIQHLYTFVKGTNFVLALTDADGYVLDLVGDDNMIQARTKKSGLTVGCCRSEQYAGTNGIGTCLTVGHPIQIWGAEHYIKPHHNYLCSAAPIRDETGKIIGCLDVVGPFDLPHTHTLAMVSASTDGIEKEIKMKKAYERIAVINNQMSSTIQSISSGIIMIDNLGIITQNNKRACDILGLKYSSLTQKNISDIINMEYSGIDLTQIERDFQNNEVTLITKDGQKLSLSLSVSCVNNDQHERTGTVLVIDELKRIHKLVNKISGFSATYTFDSILGNSQAITAVKGVAQAAAGSTSNVLILGESGTGKELLAHSIHNASHRSNGPFIAINCGSLPKGLVESELFGYEKGAFTGASRDGHPGKFELADGGTIFLDEIGDMPLELQASLLRVLQTKEIVRIGGKQKKEIDVRIIAATNVDLYKSVQKKEFRDDLYYRLDVLSIQIPPLRQRPEDILPLADHFMNQQNKILGKHTVITDSDVQKALTNYSWPGNIRELENVIERAVNLTQTGQITLEDLPISITSSKPILPIKEASAPIFQREQPPAENKTYDLLVEALRAERGNVSKTSIRLGIPKRTLYRRIQKYNINIDDFRLL